MRRLIACALFLIAGSSPQLLAAQDKAVAAQLFEAAGQLMAEGKLADACPKYAESQRLDPQLGTLLHLAECLDAQGRTASAWANFKDAVEVAAARGDLREPKIRARLAEIEPKVPRLTLRVGASAPVDLEIKRNGGIVGRPAWGLALPVDPGEYTIVASAPGRVSWSQTLALAAGARMSVEVPELAAADSGTPAQPELPPAAPIAPAEPVVETPIAPPPTAAAEPSGGGAAQRVAGWTVLGLGVVGLGVSAVFEIKSFGKLGDRDDVCPTRVDCPAGSQMKIDALTTDARDARRVGTIALIAGGVLAVGGAVLVLTAPGERAERVSMSPVIAPGYQGLSLVGQL